MNAASVNSAIEIRINELEALCHNTHLQVPQLSAILPNLLDKCTAGDCGQSRVSRLVFAVVCNSVFKCIYIFLVKFQSPVRKPQSNLCICELGLIQ